LSTSQKIHPGHLLEATARCGNNSSVFLCLNLSEHGSISNTIYVVMDVDVDLHGLLR